jgi:putative transposase
LSNQQQRNITVHRRYLFQLYPSAAQAETLREQCAMMIDLWNALLQRHEDIYRRTRGQRGVVHSEARPYYTFFDMTKEITGLRAECPEWRALSVWSAYGVAESLDLAFQAFFRRAKAGAGAQSGYPRYRSRRSGTRIPHRHSLPPGRKSGAGSGCKLVAAPRIPGSPGQKREVQSENRNHQLSVKGIDGSIHTRGIFPCETVRHSAADIIWRDSKWWFSLCVEMAPRRNPGTRKIIVDFDLIDGLARVIGMPNSTANLIDMPSQLADAAALGEHIDALKSARDKRWPKAARADPEWQDAQAEISRASAHQARLRRDSLHVWTTRIVREASEITIRMPRVSEHVGSPHGDESHWGANTAIVSTINRATLSYAPAMAAAMLQYKAAEAGIMCEVVVNETPAIAIGSALVEAGRKLRRLKRATKKEEAA